MNNFLDVFMTVLTNFLRNSSENKQAFFENQFLFTVSRIYLANRYNFLYEIDIGTFFSYQKNRFVYIFN